MQRKIGTILVVSSGLISYLDKYIVSNNINFNNNFGYNNTADFVWGASIMIAPLLLTIGANLRPYKISYLFPVFIYSTYLFWVFRQDKTDYGYAHYYGALVTVLFIIMMIVISIMKKKEEEKKMKEEERITFLENMLDLSYTVIKKRNEEV